MRQLGVVRSMVAALALVGAASIAHATVVIGNFENGSTDGWEEATSSGLTPFTIGTPDSAGVTYTFSSTGATLGSSSLEQNLGSNTGYETDLGFDILGNNDLAAFQANDVISLDWTAPAAGGATAGYQHVVNIVLNSQNGGYKNIGTSPLTTQYYYSGFNGMTYYGVSVNYDAYKASLPAGNPGGWLQLEITTQAGGGAPSNMYFDNINLSQVPEPASLSVLGIGAAGLMLRKRRTA